jgi:hypothetical protein
MDRTCSTHGEKLNKCMVSVEEAEGKRPLGRLRRRWEIILKWIFEK